MSDKPSDKEIILRRIREGLKDVRSASDPEHPGPNAAPQPPVPEVWPIVGMTAEEKFELFQAELYKVAGELQTASDEAQGGEKIQEFLYLNNIKSLAVDDKPLLRELASGLSGVETLYSSQWDEADEQGIKETISGIGCSLVQAEAFLADTGSCLLRNRTVFERLCCYLAPVCIVVGRRSTICENMPDVWPRFKELVSQTTQGEFLFVTGPSRTADIEKKLVLGVHGPRKLFVVMIQD